MTGFGYLVGPVYRAAQAVAVLLLVPVDVLADDDGVVDDDAEHQDEGEEGEHVDGDVEAGHQRDRPQERDRDPEADPEREAQLQEQRQHQEDEREPREAVLQHQRELVVQRLRLVLPDGERDTLREARLRLSDVLGGQRGELDRALVPGAEDGDHHRRLDVEASFLIGLLEPVDDRRHVAEVQAAAVGPRPEDQVLELRSAVGLPDRPQQDLPPLRPHRPAR